MKATGVKLFAVDYDGEIMRGRGCTRIQLSSSTRSAFLAVSASAGLCLIGNADAVSPQYGQKSMPGSILT